MLGRHLATDFLTTAKNGQTIGDDRLNRGKQYRCVASMLAVGERLRWRLFHAPKLTDATGGPIIAILSRKEAAGPPMGDYRRSFLLHRSWSAPTAACARDSFGLRRQLAAIPNRPAGRRQRRLDCW